MQGPTLDGDDSSCAIESLVSCGALAIVSAEYVRTHARRGKSWQPFVGGRAGQTHSARFFPFNAMDDDTPTHFNVVVLGTGLTESILAAYAPTSRSNRVLSSQSPLSALSKSGYSVLQLDSNAYYGSSWASLSLTELTAWSDANPSASHAVLDPSILPQSHRFSLSLSPALLPANGPAIEVLVRSKVAAYLQFGILGGVGLWRSEGEVERVPSSKADVFTHPTLSLLEKRRLTKFLLAIAGEGDWPTAGT